ncbi:MAG: thioredoxin fold domain-containing protein, partial [Bacteroidota bacterium]
MKKVLILLAFAFLLGSNSYAQSGIQFSHGTWSELLAKAEKENKLIFMDAYAEWCGPCKKMAKDVFTQEEVGKFYNAKFINVKMDMEKGEGIDLSRQYGVMAYPTLLFLNKDGEIVHRSVGYQSATLLLDLGNAALDPNRNAGGLANKYKNGDRSPELLHAYAMQLYDAMDGSYGKVAEEYLAKQQDWSSEKNMEFIFQMANDLDSKLFDYIVQHKQAFEQKFGEQAVAGKIEELVQGKIAKAGSEADLKAVEDFYAKTYPERAG